MSPRLPQLSGERLVKTLEKLGYKVVRQKGSHIRMSKPSPDGDHHLTIPNHPVIAKGTLNDIITKASLRNNISKDDLLKLLS